MSRPQLEIRDAVPSDAADVLVLWAQDSRRHEHEVRLDEAVGAIARMAADPDQRLLVGVAKGRVVSLVHLSRLPISLLRTEVAVHATYLMVLPDFRRLGLGHLLVEAAVAWAEEHGIANISMASSSRSRDANRFMARLGLAQVVTFRMSSTVSLRAHFARDKAISLRRGSARSDLGQLLAHRRSQRRRETEAAGSVSSQE